MEVRRKPNKDTPIYSNSFITYNNNNNNNNKNSPLVLEEEKSPTLDPFPQEIYKDTNPNPNPNPSLSPEAQMIRYRECQRNHAAHLGSHVVDGCGEFMPLGEEGTPLALKCAACDCHRNFHRREVEGQATAVAAATTITTAAAPYIPLRPLAPTPTPTPTPATTNCYISFSKYHNNNLLPVRPITDNNNSNSVSAPTNPVYLPHPRARVMMMAFGGGAAESSSDDLNAGDYLDYGGHSLDQYGVSKKRYRTKFSQEQKDKMTEFAEKIGWRIHKQDDVQVQRFCQDVGVKRQVFKVWMHNNKQAIKKNQS